MYVLVTPLVPSSPEQNGYQTFGFTKEAKNLPDRVRLVLPYKFGTLRQLAKIIAYIHSVNKVRNELHLTINVLVIFHFVKKSSQSIIITNFFTVFLSATLESIQSLLHTISNHVIFNALH